MREVREADASVIERGQSEGRLRISGSAYDLSAGEPILVWLADLGWMPARVEWDSRLGWVAYVRESTGRGEASVLVFLCPGLKARRP